MTRSFVSAVVVTVAAGCAESSDVADGGRDCCVSINPPGPQEFAGLADGQVLVRVDSSICRQYGGSVPIEVICPDGFPSDTEVRRDGDECTATAVVVCPPPDEATCNPPPPMPVACPTP